MQIVPRGRQLFSRNKLVSLGICACMLAAFYCIQRMQTVDPVAQSVSAITASSINLNRDSSSNLNELALSTTDFPVIQTSFETPVRTRTESIPNSISTISGTSATRGHRINPETLFAFEQRIVDLWGEIISAEMLDPNGDRIKVSIRQNDQLVPLMVVDHPNSSAFFIGPEHLFAAWDKAITAIKQSTADSLSGQIELVGLQTTSAKVLRHAVALIGNQEPEVFLRQDDRNRTTTIVAGGQEGQILQEVEGLKGQVTIEIIEALNAIVLRGDREDVAKVKALIESIITRATIEQPLIEIIALRNSNSTRLKSQVEQAYTQMYQPTLGPINITALSEPDRLMVIGQEPAINAVKVLVDRLDVALPEVDVTGPGNRTFKLKHMSAFDAATRLRLYFQTVDVGAVDTTPFEPYTVIDDYRSNTLVVKGSQRSLEITAELLTQWDVDESESVNVVRVFRLRNALAADLQVALHDAINGQLQGAGLGYTPSSQFQGSQFQQFEQTAQGHIRSAMLQLQIIGPNGEFIKSGILYDVRITAEANSNSLIVSAPEKSIELISQLIQQLDTIPDAETLIKVFTVNDGDANVLLQMLQTLFGSQAQQQGGFGQQQTNLGNLPLQNAAATSGSTLVDLRFSVDPATNSIIASGTAGDLMVVEDLLLRLDQGVRNRLETSVYRLSNVPVEDVANTINTWLADRRAVSDLDPTSANVPLELARREVIVAPELVSNSLIVSATPEYFGEIERIIRSLDRRPPMVQIKVLIAEVELNDTEEFGIEFGIQDSLLFDRGIGTIGFPFNQVGLGNNSNAVSLATRENLAGQGLSNLGVGRTNPRLGYGGLVLSAGNESINILLRALKDKNRLRVLGTPHITTMDNLQATITVGAQVPRLQGVTQSNFGTTNDVVDVPVGVILQVTPRVSPDGMIVMAIDTIKSSVGPEAQGIAVFVDNNGNVIRSPQILTTEAATTIMARSGQSVAFSGLITTENSYSKRGIPIISDLPWIGPLFSFESELNIRKELLIIMTPYLIDSQEQLDRINQVEADRMHWCMCDVVDIYGNISSIHGPDVLDQHVPTIFYPDSDPFGLQPKNTPAYRVLEGGFQPLGGEDLYRYAPGETAPPSKVLPPEFLEYPYHGASDANANEWRDTSHPVLTLPPHGGN